MELRCAAVIGLGLMGGSVAREAAARGVRVLGFDTDPATREAALRDGVVESMLGPSLDGIEQAEAIILATPVRSAIEILHRLGDCPGVRLVTDLASTKRSLVSAGAVSGVCDRFVGAHPLAGDHLSGWASGRLGLFRGARIYLCPGQATIDARQLAQDFWTELGGRVEWIDEGDHDRLLACSSHLPQLASSAVARVLDRAGIGRATLGPGGRDVTRLAASPAEMWTEIALDNRDFLGSVIETLEEELAEVRRLLEAGDHPAVTAWLRGASRWSAGCRDPAENPVETVAAPSSAG